LKKAFVIENTRIFFACLSLFAAVACSDQQKSEQSQVTRVNAVKGDRDQLGYQKWCDRVFSQAQAPKLELPPFEPVGKQVASASIPAQRWVWVNFWATWCKPCVREMPMLQLWQNELSKLGQSLDLWFVSVDQDKAELEQFLNGHPDIAAANTVRITGSDALETWLKKYGVDAMASVPIHLIAAPGGGVRCVRTGSLNDGDFGIVKNLVR